MRAREARLPAEVRPVIWDEGSDSTSLDEALHLVAVRGRLMQRMATGSMLSVPLPVEEVVALLPDEVSVAAVNAPAHCVVSGRSETIADLEARLAGRGVRAAVFEGISPGRPAAPSGRPAA